MFADRRAAGRRLAAALAHLRDAKPLVLALPRGGVPVGFEVARALAAPLDVLLVRKIGAPDQPEFGLGAVVDGDPPQVVIDESLVGRVEPPPGYVQAETVRQIAELERRRALYASARPGLDWEGRSAIVVDDGIATGGTVRAALRGLRPRMRALVLAVPVGPADTLWTLRSEADEIVCLSTPDDFSAVGVFYADFAQTGDAEVMQLLREAQPK
ncbi:MAG: phosphoribosyltransferase [Acidisphaera sp.]|nr:phosphoribosyltransferase [Acidisphaera sp.]